MAKKTAQTQPAETPAPAAPVDLRYVGPPDAESSRYGSLVPGRCYQEADPDFAAYLTAQHPDHWALA